MGLDALALLEIASIAVGYRALDLLVKESPVRVVEANLVEPGKFLILFGGGVAEVEAAMRVGRAAAGPLLLDEVLLPGVDPRIWGGVSGVPFAGGVDTIGIIEGSAVATVIDACDRSLKNAGVTLAGLRISRALGGKAFYVVEGEQYDVEAAIEVGVACLSARDRLVRAELIPRPHPDFLAHLLRPPPFGSA